MPHLPRQSFALEGLRKPAEIVLDSWGVPHIRAESAWDVFLAQGFNAARERLFQIDLWRKRGLGLLAADFGPGFLEQDKAARLFVYNGDIEADWRAYGPEAKPAVTAFVAGINAFVALTEADPALLPPEFPRLGTRPARWRPEDVTRIRSHAVSQNATSELARWRVLAAGGAAVDFARKTPLPPAAPALPPDIPARIPQNLLRLLALATAPVQLTPARLAAGLDDAARWNSVDALGAVTTVSLDEGSNNWAVAGHLTGTGRPVMASDPHRAVAAPALRYVAHLTCDAFDVIGAGEPCLPGLSIGHNADAAFSLTTAPMDQEDIVFLRLDPDRPDHFAFQGGFEPLTRRRERFEIRGHDAVEIDQFHSPHGPVIAREGGHAYALRTVWSEPGAAPYLASLGYQGAASPADFRKALENWRVPGSNQIYADREGHLLWQMCGAAPKRSRGQGLVPAPGEHGPVWDGFLRLDEFPSSLDPAEGYVLSANEFNLPEGFTPPATIGHDWFEGARAARIREVLASGAPHDPAAARALQTDAVSLPARRLLALLARHIPGPGAAPAQALLTGWDAKAGTGSAPAALFEIWWNRHLRPAVLRAIAGAALAPLLAPGDNDAVLDWLERQATPALFDETLPAAWAEAARLMGADPAAWAWGRLHHTLFTHPAGALEGAEGWTLGPVAAAGTASTVLKTAYRLADFRTSSTATLRLVMDVGNWDASVFVNAPGQSGRPGDPHYDDMLAPWSAGDYVPLLFSCAAVDAAAAAIVTLLPAEAPPAEAGRP